jgi:D5 N terminal like/Bifunctional DNA primase/polymerase, N-terminal
MKVYENQSNKDSSSEEQRYNNGADFWRYNIGANVIPANTRKKETYESWKQWQDKPIPQELHEQWKSSGAFNQGMAIIPGKVWHHIGKKELYLIAIDLDNQKAIEEVALDGLEELAKHIIVEQHRDDLTKAHVLLYSHKPFPKKSSDNLTPSLNSKLDANEVPAIEVKGLGTHGILYVTPSIHKNGQPYEIIGTLEPIIVDDFVFHINDICKKYDIPYLDGNGDGHGGDSSTQIPIQDLFQEDFVVVEGHNRHEALLRAMDSLIARNYGILSLAEIKSIARGWNDQHCKPPLDDREFEKQWKCATDFISKSRRAAEAEAPQNGEGEKRDSDSKYLDLADELIQKYHLKTIEVIKHLYYFDSRVYANNGQTVVEKELEIRYLRALVIYQEKIARMSPEQLKKSKIEPPMPWTRKKIDELVGMIERRTYINIKDFDSDIDWLACDNCMLNLRTYSTAPFSPKFLNTTHIPVEYSDVYARGPAADFFRLVEGQNYDYRNYQCPKIMKFLYDIVEAEDVEYILDFIAYCLWRTYKYANWLLCEGYGQNGKSILFNLIEKFLGIENTSAESLERLLDERFANAQLYQKLVNIDAMCLVTS